MKEFNYSCKFIKFYDFPEDGEADDHWTWGILVDDDDDDQ